MRAKIRRRVVFACVGALLFMAFGIYFALSRAEGGGGAGLTSAGGRALAALGVNPATAFRRVG